jgi:hypothetical protein
MCVRARRDPFEAHKTPKKVIERRVRRSHENGAQDTQLKCIHSHMLLDDDDDDDDDENGY